MKKLFIVANWKMNGNKKSNRQLIKYINKKVSDNSNIEVVICPPFIYLNQILELKRSSIKVGAQNISENQNGAFTGEVSGSMLLDMDINYVIVGHSERRQIYNDTNDVVARKFELAHKNNLTPILCVGETLNERKTRQTLSIVESQIKSVIESTQLELLAKSIIAYEPVWAIGTGETASPEQAEEVHFNIRNIIEEYDPNIATSIPILYGGSVNGANSKDLFTMGNINGGLIGGASLNEEEFLEIYQQTESLINE
ncbi:MAG: triosephosphate isomerase [Gammaproteobacteria bacterium]|nr:MAG: triosephosphate isomerase [Gammaproteobacteria bacterium]